MARLRASWCTSLPGVQQPRNPQSESIARSPYEGLVRPNLGTHELTRVARVGRAEPHAKEDGPWTTIARLTSDLTRRKLSTPWPSRRAAERQRCAISARSRPRRQPL